MTDMNEWDYDEINDRWINNKNHIVKLKHPKYINICEKCYNSIMEDDNYVCRNDNYYCENCNNENIIADKYLLDHSKEAQLSKEEEKLHKQYAKETEAKDKKYEANRDKQMKENKEKFNTKIEENEEKMAKYNKKYTHNS